MQCTYSRLHLYLHCFWWIVWLFLSSYHFYSKPFKHLTCVFSNVCSSVFTSINSMVCLSDFAKAAKKLQPLDQEDLSVSSPGEYTWCLNWFFNWSQPPPFSPLLGAVIGDGQSAVASNIANTTYRLQWWDFTKFDLPEISNGKLEKELVHLTNFRCNSLYRRREGEKMPVHVHLDLNL